MTIATIAKGPVSPPSAKAARRMSLAAGLLGVLLPFAAQAYNLPLRGDDLSGSERYNTFVHADGIQAEGKDIGARRNVSKTSWSWLKTDGANQKVLGNWIVYGKPVYAMAAGTVIACWRNAPENEPGSYHADYEAKKIPGGGNHFWILQDDGVYALYAHMQPGSVPTSLCPHNAKLLVDNSNTGSKPAVKKEAKVTNGAKIKAGQLLGKVGNSGASKGGPHLHVHMEKAGKPVVMTFARGLTTAFPDGKASINGPWARIAGKALPEASILLWPPRPIGNYTFNGTKSADFQRLFDHLADSGMLPDIITCKSNGATYNAKWIPAKGAWRAHFGMSATEAAAQHAFYVHEGYKRTSSFTCGSVSVAVWRK